MRCILVGVTALAAACFNPSGNGSDSDPVTTTTGTSPDSSTGDPPTSSAGPTATADPDTGSSVGPSADPGTTASGDPSTDPGVTTTGDTAGPTTVDPDTTAGTTDATTGTCGKCDTCEICQDNGCAPAPENEPCTPPDDACDEIAFGTLANVCYAAKPTGGACTVDGTCAPKCDEQGASWVYCTDELCVRPNGPCTKGKPLAGIALGDFCVVNATTLMCNAYCDDLNQVATPRMCDDVGGCVEGMGIGCDPYACNPNTGTCKVMCTSELDCDLNADCMGNVCV